MTMKRLSKAQRRETRKQHKMAERTRERKQITNVLYETTTVQNFSQPRKPTLPPIVAKNPAQKVYLSALESHKHVFGIGPAGTGKTFLAVAWAVKKLVDGEITKIIITRPTVSSDKEEEIGFLPGDINMKFTPWALPVIDSIEKLIPKTLVKEWLRNGTVDFAPFQFMRGRTFDENTVVILDEAQNCRLRQFQLFLTRLGDCCSVINGDPTQADIKDSGLMSVVALIRKHGVSVAVCLFDNNDVVRSDICKQWVEAFAEYEKDSTHAARNQVIAAAPFGAYATLDRPRPQLGLVHAGASE